MKFLIKYIILIGLIFAVTPNLFGVTERGSPSLLDLPKELQAIIAGELLPRDFVSLTSACRDLKNLQSSSMDDGASLKQRIEQLWPTMSGRLSVGAEYALFVDKQGRLKSVNYPTSMAPRDFAEIVSPIPFKSVSNFWKHGCALRVDGVVMCFGERHSQPPSDLRAKQLTTGYNYACAVQMDDTVSCWGHATDGELIPPASKFREIAGGAYHICGIQTDGHVSCWGNPKNAVLNVPVFEDGFEPMHITANTFEACVLAKNGKTKCWGQSSGGVKPVAELVRELPSGLKQLVMGTAYLCGLESSGKVTCVVDYVNKYSPRPVVPSNLPPVKFLASANSRVCAWRRDGVITCFGVEYYSPPSFNVGQ